MIWDNPVLERIVDKESFAEIIGRLTPAETTVALLRADGLDDQQIAQLLGITRSAVQARIKLAVQRISRELPEAGSLLAGRNRFNTASRCLTIPDECDMICSAEAAKLLGCCRQTIRNWIAAGRFPNAQQQATGHWLIPWGDLERLV